MEISANAKAVLERRYLQKENGIPVETPEAMLRRVAAHIAGVEGSVFGASQDGSERINGNLFSNDGPEEIHAQFTHPDECRPDYRPTLGLFCAPGGGFDGKYL